MLFEMLTGETPFGGYREAQIYRQVHTRPTAPEYLNRGVPADLSAVCLKCLEKDPARRYADCVALAEDL